MTCPRCGVTRAFNNSKQLAQHQIGFDCRDRRVAQQAAALGLERAGGCYQLLRSVGLAQKRAFEDKGNEFYAPTWAVRYAQRFMETDVLYPVRLCNGGLLGWEWCGAPATLVACNEEGGQCFICYAHQHGAVFVRPIAWFFDEVYRDVAVETLARLPEGIG